MHSKVQTFASPAKVNHFLHITGRRADGYHTLQTIMQFVDWCDELAFQVTDSNHITLSTIGQAPCDTQDNLVYKAAKLLQARAPTQVGVNIELTKHIPAGGGLGGGSSNAATTMLALNKLWNINLNQAELSTLGLSLGADIPFFIGGHAALAEGIGEQLTPLECEQNWLLIAHPGCLVSTQAMYSDKNLTRDTPAFKIGNHKAKAATATHLDSNKWHNDFLAVVLQHYPEVKKAYEWLNGYAQASLSGSGACIFARFESKQSAQQVAEQAPEWLPVFVTKGLNQSPLLTRNPELHDSIRCSFEHQNEFSET